MTPDITLLTVNWNTKDCLSLLLKTYVKHHYTSTPLKLMLWDNSSTDDSKEWMIENDIPFFESTTNVGHEAALNVMFNAITTRYCFLADTDLFFKDSIYPYLDHFNETVVAAGDLVQGDRLGDTMIKPRLGAWAILFDMQIIKNKGIRTFRTKSDCAYDVMSEFYENLWKNNLQPHIIPRFPGNINDDIIGMDYERFSHLGKLSWNLDNHGDRRDEVNRRKAFVLEKLKEYEDIDLRGKYV